MKFGFVGLGQMGAPMAINLGQQNDVLVYDRNTNAVANVGQSGAKTANEPDQFADVDVLITCLPNAKIVESALFDQKAGLVQHLKAGALVVDTSTIEYSATLELKNRLQTADLRFLDAPVSGMQKRAEDGTLTMMVGGEGNDLAEVHDALSTMASKILHMGDVGAGQLTKLINQLLFDINAAALAEILPLSVKLGLDPEQVADVVNSGTGRSYASEFFVPKILTGDFGNGYPMQAAYKDLVSGAEISAGHNIPTPVLAAATATYQQALLEGHGDKDKGGMILVYERLLNIAFRAALKSGDKT
ncbi:NAD(P)-dependent oxidoreductase [Rhodobacterales bacterium FZCC0083]|nr:NAD(P)-dependent oxidoreductase [Rhodobacterales bacterium FZCC0083]